MNKTVPGFFRRLSSTWLSEEKRTAKTIIYAALFIGAWLINRFSQFFCVPVLWASIALLLFVAAFLAHPYVQARSPLFTRLTMLVQGFGLWICVYCFLFYFTESDNQPLHYAAFLGFLFILSLVFWPIILPVFLPVVILRRFKRCTVKYGRIFFLAGMLLPLPFVLWAGNEYRQISSAIAALGPDAPVEQLAKTIPRSYMGERIAGLHFRYHTRLCYYDGWRPPYHDPLVVVAMWLNGYKDPLREGIYGYTYPTHYFSLEQRVQLYRLMFPGRNPAGDCGCTPSVEWEYLHSGYFEEPKK